MRPLLALSNSIDWLNEKIGGVCNWLVLAACVVSAGNAMIRYAFGYSSNAWLELQWYMFAVFVMFGASYTFKKNEHVRVEILYLMLSERGQLKLDLIGTVRLGAEVQKEKLLAFWHDIVGKTQLAMNFNERFEGLFRFYAGERSRCVQAYVRVRIVF